ncbi:hypothetical protein K435DRAFT_922317 [Dendrothele bispora CBS 962.96]|uniref:Uncharacterized protein n=1 Tax=Dendrothele bispora (strain CBS 962.96) TaxID=1314807 RepID=A0A4V4HDB2_DENBC|nr:hypothetical protein K435DRAFT_922317 [Dendrothele bispora CBS 962.96]
MVPPPSTISRRVRNSQRASVTDFPDEAEPAVQLSTPSTMPLDGLRRTAAFSLSRYRRSPLPVASRIGIKGASVPALTPTGTSITAHNANANILRTVSTNANSLSPSITQNNLQFIETLQVLNNSSNNTFSNPIITTSARDSNSYSYSFYGPSSFYGPTTLNVHPDFINQLMLRTQSAGLRGLDSTAPSVSNSDLQGSVSLRPWIDADTLERGDGIEAPTMGMNRNSRLRSFINGDGPLNFRSLKLGCLAGLHNDPHPDVQWYNSAAGACCTCRECLPFMTAI